MLSYTSAFDTAEWVHEAPTGSSGVLTLVQTTDADFTGARLTTPSGTCNLGAFLASQILMDDSSGNIKAEPGCLPSSDRFDVSTYC